MPTNSTEERDPLGVDMGMYGILKDDVNWALLKERTALELEEGLLPFGHCFVTDAQIQEMTLLS